VRDGRVSEERVNYSDDKDMTKPDGRSLRELMALGTRNNMLACVLRSS